MKFWTSIQHYRRFVLLLIIAVLIVNILRPMVPKLKLELTKFVRLNNSSITLFTNQVPLIRAVRPDNIFQHDAPIGTIWPSILNMTDTISQSSSPIVSRDAELRIRQTVTPNLVILPNDKKVNTTTGPLGSSARQQKLQELQRKVMDVTIVTAYFNLGQFEKGGPGNVYTPKKYLDWMRVFSVIKNPVIAFLDSNDSVQYMRQLRKGKPGKVFLVNRDEMWAFKLKNRISEIYNQPRYARHKPNTVVPDYSCAMHAKFESLNMSIDLNFYNSTYFSWIDIGLFRDISNIQMKQHQKEFGLIVPNDFDKNKVAYAHVSNFNHNHTWRDLVFGNHVSVGGAGNLATKDVMKKFIDQYKRTAEGFMSQHLMSTDQQLIYGMYVTEGDKSGLSKVQLHVYKAGWFRIGYLMRETWLKEYNEITQPKQSNKNATKTEAKSDIKRPSNSTVTNSDIKKPSNSPVTNSDVKKPSNSPVTNSDVKKPSNSPVTKGAGDAGAPEPPKPQSPRNRDRA